MWLVCGWSPECAVVAFYVHGVHGACASEKILLQIWKLEEKYRCLLVRVKVEKHSKFGNKDLLRYYYTGYKSLLNNMAGVFRLLFLDLNRGAQETLTLGLVWSTVQARLFQCLATRRRTRPARSKWSWVFQG